MTKQHKDNGCKQDGQMIPKVMKYKIEEKTGIYQGIFPKTFVSIEKVREKNAVIFQERDPMKTTQKRDPWSPVIEKHKL